MGLRNLTRCKESQVTQKKKRQREEFSKGRFLKHEISFMSGVDPRAADWLAQISAIWLAFLSSFPVVFT